MRKLLFNDLPLVIYITVIIRNFVIREKNKNDISFAIIGVEHHRFIRYAKGLHRPLPNQQPRNDANGEISAHKMREILFGAKPGLRLPECEPSQPNTRSKRVGCDFKSNKHFVFSFFQCCDAIAEPLLQCGQKSKMAALPQSIHTKE
jgi:hypothetical protein